jgi:hypothetical protein
MPDDAEMNSSKIQAEDPYRAFRSLQRVPYTWSIMSVQTVIGAASRRPEGRNALGLPCAAVSEVQIGAIPKLSSWEVASTP